MIKRDHCPDLFAHTHSHSLIVARASILYCWFILIKLTKKKPSYMRLQNIGLLLTRSAISFFIFHILISFSPHLLLVLHSFVKQVIFVLCPLRRDQRRKIFGPGSQYNWLRPSPILYNFNNQVLSCKCFNGPITVWLGARILCLLTSSF